MISTRLRKLREELKIEQQEMAKIFKMHKSTYNNYETGRREPDIKTIKMMADYFNVSTDYLLGQTDDKNIKIIIKEDLPIELQEIGMDYLGINKEMKDKGISPEQVKKILKVYEDLKGL